MIEPADKYEEQLKNLYPVDGDEWYRYNLPLNVVRQRMVSIHNGEVIGSIDLTVNLAASAVLEIPVMTFSEKNRYVFAKDIMTFIRYLMQKYRKMNFFVLIGSPTEKTYDRLAKILGWKIVGIMEKQVQNIYGEWNDIKYYEWINPNWRPENDTD
ncbi:MAG: hypothetical protein LBV17_07675 [Treponema sp.]|jgi:hypothetical protein|nr:hypothetical protein [Treponema sp.]